MLHFIICSYDKIPYNNDKIPIQTLRDYFPEAFNLPVYIFTITVASYDFRGVMFSPHHFLFLPLSVSLFTNRTSPFFLSLLTFPHLPCVDNKIRTNKKATLSILSCKYCLHKHVLKPLSELINSNSIYNTGKMGSFSNSYRWQFHF